MEEDEEVGAGNRDRVKKGRVMRGLEGRRRRQKRERREELPDNKH